MTAAILSCVWLLWPILAFAGGLGFAPLIALVALPLAPLALPHIRPRPYMAAIAAVFVYAAITSFWSPKAMALFDDGKMIKVGLAVLAAAVMIAACERLDDKGRTMLLRFAQASLAVQVAVVAVLAMFENQILDLLSFAMPDAGEGVQNITRNSLIMAVAAPFLIQSVTENRSPRMAILIALAILAVESAVLMHRGVNGGVFALLLATAAVGVVAVWRRTGFRILASGIAMLVWTAPMFFGFLSLGADASKAVTSPEYRLAIWRRVIALTSERPVEGSGLGVLRTIKETIPSGEFAGGLLVPNHAHNMLLQLWAETGAIGAGLVAVAVLMAGWRLPAPKRLGVAAPRIAGLAGAVTAIASVSFDLWNEWWWAVVGFLAMLAAVVAHENTPRRAAPARRAIAHTEQTPSQLRAPNL